MFNILRTTVRVSAADFMPKREVIMDMNIEELAHKEREMDEREFHEYVGRQLLESLDQHELDSCEKFVKEIINNNHD